MKDRDGKGSEEIGPGTHGFTMWMQTVLRSGSSVERMLVMHRLAAKEVLPYTANRPRMAERRGSKASVSSMVRLHTSRGAGGSSKNQSSMEAAGVKACQNVEEPTHSEVVKAR